LRGRHGTTFDNLPININMSALTHANEHTLSILKQYHPPSTALEILNTRIVNKPFPLRADPIPKPTAVNPNDNRTLRRKLKKQNNRKPQPLSAKSKRELGVHAIPHSLRRSLSYEIFLPLNELWVGYAQELVALSGGAGGPAVAAKIAVGDLHGAIVKVVRSRAVDRVGIEGIVIKETRSVLEIVVKGMGLKGLCFQHPYMFP
jgi:ribonuclease P protein subunit POP4